MISRFPVFTSPKRWVFVDPDTSYNYEENDQPSLIKRIKAYREQNNLPEITAINVVIENYLCNLPENKGVCKPVKLERGWMQYVRGGIALLNNLYYGDKSIVTQEVAEERAKQCLGCSLNTFPDKDSFQTWSDHVAQMMIGDRKVSTHDKLGNCAGCTCLLKSKVWFGGKISLNETERDMMSKATNGSCWQFQVLK